MIRMAHLGLFFRDKGIWKDKRMISKLLGRNFLAFQKHRPPQPNESGFEESGFFRKERKSDKREEGEPLNEELGNIDIVFVRVESFHDAPFVVPPLFIHLSEVNYLSLPILPIAIRE